MTLIWLFLRGFWPYALGLAVFLGGWYWFEATLDRRYEEGQHSVQQRWDAEHERSRALLEESDHLHASAVLRTQETYDAHLKTATLRASGLAAELNRLRASAPGSARPPVDPASPCATFEERDRRLELLLREGAELVAEGSGRVGALDAKVTGLQVYAQGLQP